MAAYDTGWRRDITDNEWHAAVKAFGENELSWDRRTYGARPGHAGCRVPPRILAAHGYLKVIAMEAKNPADKSQSDDGCMLRWHGEPDPYADQTFLVDGLLPEVGTALLSGPWGVYKTFVAIDLALSVMTGTDFAGRPVNRKGGVLFLAAEAGWEIPRRIRAAYEVRGGDGGKLPFAWIDDFPKLRDKRALKTLEHMATQAHARMMKDFGLPLAVIIIDTVAASAGFSDEQSNAEGQAVMDVLTALARKMRALSVGVDHFGKSIEAGTRGGSAKEGSADAVLALLGERDLSGNVSNTKMAIRKMRGAPTGTEIKFGTKVVEIGTDRTGKPMTTLVIEWGGAVEPVRDRGAWPKPLRVFHHALVDALLDHGIALQPFPDGPIVRLVDRERVRDAFYAIYPADGETEDQRKNARRQAYHRSMKDAQERGLIGVKVDGETTLVWLAKDEEAPKQRDVT